MNTKHQKMEPRANAAAWRKVKCPVCKAATNEPCHNVLVEVGKVRPAHAPRIEAAGGRGKHRTRRTRRQQKAA